MPRQGAASSIAVKRAIFPILLLCVVSIACGSIAAERPAASPTASSLFDQILGHAAKLQPALNWGEPAGIGAIKLTPSDYALDEQYVLAGEAITPPPGAKYLWISLNLTNVGDNAESPILIYELYYKGEVTHATTFGEYHPDDRPGISLRRLFPGQSLEGWILFEVPEAIDLTVAYLTVRPAVSPAEYSAWRITSQ